MTGFNSYMQNIDTTFFRQLCMESGQLKHLKRNEYLFQAGEVWPYWGFLKKGIVRYTCNNRIENKIYNVGFSFAHEFFADYPACLYRIPAEISIQTLTPCDIYICSSQILKQALEEKAENIQLARMVAEQLFFQCYTRYIDLYRFTPEERYRHLLKRCPEILQLLTLKEIASYLKITPTHMSRIRKSITMST